MSYEDTVKIGSSLGMMYNMPINNSFPDTVSISSSLGFVGGTVDTKDILVRTGIVVIGLPLLTIGIIKLLEQIGAIEHENLSVNPASKRYYVKTRTVREDGRTIKGWTRGPYTLSSAKDYARIGSQFGRPRTVHRGRGGPRIRRYSGGKRAWPVMQTQLRSLRPAEKPRRLN